MAEPAPAKLKVIATWERAADTPSYDAGVEPVTGVAYEPCFTEHYQRHAERTRFEATPRQVLISDRALWIERVMLVHHPDTMYILEFFHKSEQLYDVCIDHYRQEHSA